MNGEHPNAREAPTTDPVTIVDRLRMRYAIGPMVNGEPEFGWRDMGGPAPEGCVLPTPLMLEGAAEIERLNREASLLMRALVESVKLQAHYAGLLNMHDGGERIVFQNAAEWLKRIQERT